MHGLVILRHCVRVLQFRVVAKNCGRCFDISTPDKSPDSLAVGKPIKIRITRVHKHMKAHGIHDMRFRVRVGFAIVSNNGEAVEKTDFHAKTLDFAPGGPKFKDISVPPEKYESHIKGAITLRVKTVATEIAQNGQKTKIKDDDASIRQHLNDKLMELSMPSLELVSSKARGGKVLVTVRVHNPIHTRTSVVLNVVDGVGQRSTRALDISGGGSKKQSLVVPVKLQTSEEPQSAIIEAEYSNIFCMGCEIKLVFEVTCSNGKGKHKKCTVGRIDSANQSIKRGSCSVNNENDNGSG